MNSLEEELNIQRQLLMQQRIKSIDLQSNTSIKSISSFPCLGLTSTSLTCNTCKYNKLVCLESFQCLSIPIPLSFRSNVTLEDCLLEYFQCETLSLTCMACSHRQNLLSLQKQQQEVQLMYEILNKTKHHPMNDLEIELKQIQQDINDLQRSISLGVNDTFIKDNDIEVYDEEQSSLKLQTTFSKQSLIIKLPLLLCIHISRRVYDEIRGDMKKVSQYISFPMILTNIQEYCYLPIDVSYQLVAVVSHIGSSSSSANSGHYITYCKVKNKQGSSVWILASDANIKLVSLETVLNCEAYLLFYER